MKLKPQPRPRPARSGPRRRSATGPRGRSRGGRQARRPGTPLRGRLARRLPRLGRVLAVLAGGALTAALFALVNGPWLRVAEVSWAGDRYTDGEALANVLEPERGASLLALDTAELRRRIADLPAVAEVEVRALLPDQIEATIVEREPAFVWETPRARLVGSADGVIFAVTSRNARPGPELAGLPRIDDDRRSARVMRVGDSVPEGFLDVALRMAAIDPAALGSGADALGVRIDDRNGFSLVADEPGWQAAFGLYGHDPTEAPGDAAARIERQITAVRTLFANRPEAGIGWVDARNPGKVYFRAKG